jgi:uncharacterized membrane protein
MEFYPLSQPEEITEREKEDAMGSYLMMFAAVAVGLPLPIINLIASVVYYFVNRKKSRFIHFHCLQSLLSQIPTTLINWVVVIWAVRIIFTDLKVDDTFWAAVIFAGLSTFLYFIVSIIAAFKARQGKMYYFLLFGKLAYEIAYRVRPEDSLQPTEPVNKPPF